MHRRAGSTPCPPLPAPSAEPGEGGGGRLASHVLPGDFEQGRGDLWQVNSAIILAGGFGRFSWQDILAGHFGGSFWHIYLADLPQEKKNKL